MKDRYDLDYEVLWDTNHYGEMMNLVNVLDANPDSEVLKKTASIDAMDTEEKRIALHKSPTAWQFTTEENSGFWPTIEKSDLKLQIRYPVQLPHRYTSYATEPGYREFLFSIPSQLGAKGSFKDFALYRPATETTSLHPHTPGVALYSVGDKMVSAASGGSYSYKYHLSLKLNEEKFPEWDPTTIGLYYDVGWNTPWIFAGSKYDYIHSLKKVIPVSKPRQTPRAIKSPTNKWIFFYPENQGDVTLYNLDYGTYFKVKGERRKEYGTPYNYTVKWSANEKFLYIYQGDLRDTALVINRETGEQNFIPKSDGVSFRPSYFCLSPGGDFLFWVGSSKSFLIEVATGRKIEVASPINNAYYLVWVGTEVYGYANVEPGKYSLFKASINTETAELSNMVYHDFKGGYYGIFSYLSELDLFVFQTRELEDLTIINRGLKTVATMPLPYRREEDEFSLVPFTKGLYCAKATYYKERNRSEKNGLILISAKGGEIKISFVPTPTAWGYQAAEVRVSDPWTSSIAPFRNGKFLVMSTYNYGGPGAFVSINTETLEGKACSGPQAQGFFKVTDSIFISQKDRHLLEVTENGDVVDITPPEFQKIDSGKSSLTFTILGGPYKTNPGYPPLSFTEIREITYADSETELT